MEMASFLFQGITHVDPTMSRFPSGTISLRLSVALAVNRFTSPGKKEHNLVDLVLENLKEDSNKTKLLHTFLLLRAMDRDAKPRNIPS